MIVLVGDNCEMFLQVGLSLERITSMGYLTTKSMTCANRELSGLESLINENFVTLIYVIRDTLIFAS